MVDTKDHLITSANRTKRPSPFEAALVTAPTPALLVIASVLPWPHLPACANYMDVGIADHVISGSLMVVTLFKAVASLIPQAGPLPQILGTTKDLICVINQMRANKDGCKHLVQRIISYIKNIIDELTRMNVPLRPDSPTAARLYVLHSWVKLPWHPLPCFHTSGVYFAGISGLLRKMLNYGGTGQFCKGFGTETKSRLGWIGMSKIYRIVFSLFQ